jgi:hypothetical protein
MRTSLNGMLNDVASLMSEHRLSWITVQSVYVSSGWVSVKIKSIEQLGEIAKRLKVTRRQIEMSPTGVVDELEVEFKSRGIRWTCFTKAPKSQAELIGVDGESITALPAPKRIGLRAPKRKPAALIPPSLFGGDA